MWKMNKIRNLWLETVKIEELPDIYEKLNFVQTVKLRNRLVVDQIAEKSGHYKA